MDVNEAIKEFLAGEPFAVAGASNDRSKYGNRVLRCYAEDGRRAYPVNPNQAEIEGQPAYRDLGALPEVPHGLSIVTPPEVTAAIVDQAIELGIKHLWMQPGAEEEEAIVRAREAGLSVIAHGPCLLVQLGFRG